MQGLSPGRGETPHVAFTGAEVVAAEAEDCMRYAAACE